MQKSIIRRGLRNGFQIKQINPAYTSVIGRFKYSKKYGLSVHEAAALVIARRGIGYHEKLPEELLEYLQKKVKPYLEEILTKQVSYIKGLIDKIKKFKSISKWSLWNIVNKTLSYHNYHLAINF